jgi:hypothetical protein
MKPTKKPRSILGEVADQFGPFLRKATTDELLAEIVKRAKSDRTFRSQLLTVVEPFRRGQGRKRDLPENLLQDFEIREQIVRENPELREELFQLLRPTRRKKSSLKSSRTIVLAWFGEAYDVEPKSVGRTLCRDKKKLETK